jgi:hypothetical protein
VTDPRASRQGFLGANAQAIFAHTRVAVLGLGGGGSHIVQQLAHVGFQDFMVCDPDRAEDTNLNRLVGATEEDAATAVRKVDIAARLFRGLAPRARVECFFGKWEEHAIALRGADIIFGCLDSYVARRDLELFTRRYLVPLLDIGLDVVTAPGEPPQMSGQVIASMPGAPCMTCIGFLNDVTLAQEAARYGDAGVHPQVVWANGVLASAAVGVAVDLLTNWSRRLTMPVYLEYDGNAQTLRPHVRLQYLPKRACPHFPAMQVGDPVFRAL